MLKRLISLISCLAIAEMLVAVRVVRANVSVSQLEGVAAVVLPTSSPKLDIPNLPSEKPQEQEQPSEFLPQELELPTPENTNIRPKYIEEQPLRLEIHLSRRQVKVYRGSQRVKTYSIAVGKPGWETPTGRFEVQQMFRNPTWIHPLKPGIEIPGGDPENPLGRYWIGFWTDGKNWIGFHGTPNPRSVGTAASHGCIRMYNKDIEELFQTVSLGTEVKVVK